MRGKVKSLGTDCVEKEMREEHRKDLQRLLDAAGAGKDVKVSQFRRYGSSRKLYSFHIDNIGDY